MIGLTKFITVFSLLLLMSFYSSAQDCSGISSNRSIELDSSSDKEKIKIEVTENVQKLHFGISSTITSGDLTVEIYDPKGKKQGNFSVESQLNSSTSSNAKKKELVCGSMQKGISNPMKGDWTIKLIPKKVTGTVAIHTSQQEQKK